MNESNNTVNKNECDNIFNSVNKNSNLPLLFKVNLNPLINNNDVNKLLVKQKNRDFLNDKNVKSLNISTLSKKGLDDEVNFNHKNKESNTTKLDALVFKKSFNKEKSFITNLDIINKLVLNQNLPIKDLDMSANKKSILINREKFFTKDFKLKSSKN